MKIRDSMDVQDGTFLISGIVLGILVSIFAAWVWWSPSSGNDADRTDEARLSAQEPVAASSSPQSRETDQLRRCVDAATALQPALARADSSMSQWEVHVGAMNKLVVGAISLQQATAFWNQTRVKARERITAFDRAWASAKRRGLDCPRANLLPAHVSPQVRTCAREVADDVSALQTARSAIATWSHHVHAMEMLRMGKLSPAAATDMWLAMWQRGQQQIATYRSAARSAARDSGCTADAAPSASSSASASAVP